MDIQNPYAFQELQLPLGFFKYPLGQTHGYLSPYPNPLRITRVEKSHYHVIFPTLGSSLLYPLVKMM